MAYCDRSDVEAVFDAERVDESLDSDGDGLPDAGILAKHIAWAGGQVYAYLSRRYKTYTPSSVQPGTTTAHINGIAATLAAYSALGRNGRLIQRRYDQAIDELVEIRESRNSLDGVSVGDVVDSVRKDSLRTFREKDRVVSDYGEPSPGDVDAATSRDNDFFTTPPGC